MSREGNENYIKNSSKIRIKLFNLDVAEEIATYQENVKIIRIG